MKAAVVMLHYHEMSTTSHCNVAEEKWRRGEEIRHQRNGVARKSAHGACSIKQHRSESDGVAAVMPVSIFVYSRRVCYHLSYHVAKINKRIVA